MYSRDSQASSIETWLRPSSPVLLSVGLSQPLHDLGLAGLHIMQAESARDALLTLAGKNVAVLVLGERLTSADALNILSECTFELTGDPPAAVVLCPGAEPELFQKFIDEGPIFYLVRREIDPDQLRCLVASAADHFKLKANLRQDRLNGNAPFADQLLDLCVRLPMQKNISSAGGLITQTLHHALPDSFVQCLVLHPDEETLTSAGTESGKEWSYSPASGLAAFVVRTGQRVHLDRSAADPRYDSDIDNPNGVVDARFVAEPIFGSAGTPVGVLMAVRSGESAPFSNADVGLVQFVATCAAPTLTQILLQDRVQAQLTGRAAGQDSNSEIFRQEALEYHIRNWDQQGGVLKTLPLWLRRTYWVVLALVLVALAGLAMIPGLRNIFEKVN